MKPEEIDKLFRDRLADVPAVPSADAWQRLQQKMEPPKKERSLWIYYAAASVVILLISGILLIRSNSQNQNPGLANNTQRETRPPAQDKNPFVIEENKVETRVAEETVPKPENQENKRANPTNTTEQLAQKDLAISKSKATTGKLQKKLPQVSNNKTDYVATGKEPQNSSNSNAENKINTDNSFNSTEPKAFTLADNTQPAPESALTATIVEVTVKKTYIDESADDNSLRENLAKKTMLLKNIYKQARNLKNGEPVELTALGVDKEKLQAETKEIKQKINKVISL